MKQVPPDSLPNTIESAPQSVRLRGALMYLIKGSETCYTKSARSPSKSIRLVQTILCSRSAFSWRRQ